MLRSAAIAVTLILVLGVTGEAAAQRRVAGATTPASEGTTVGIKAKLGSNSYQANGAGSCRYAPMASIRGVPASLWMVEYSGTGGNDLKQLNLTLWRPKDGGPDQVSLSLDTKSGSRRIDTGREGSAQGAAKVKLSPSGAGGTLEIIGKDANAKAVQVTITCPTFAGIEAEGG